VVAAGDLLGGQDSHREACEKKDQRKKGKCPGRGQGGRMVLVSLGPRGSGGEPSSECLKLGRKMISLTRDVTTGQGKKKNFGTACRM